jgi:hypothetical protein
MDFAELNGGSGLRSACLPSAYLSNGSTIKIGSNSFPMEIEKSNT